MRAPVPLKDGGHPLCIRKGQPVAWEGWVGGGDTGGRKIHGSGQVGLSQGSTVGAGAARTDGRNAWERPDLPPVYCHPHSLLSGKEGRRASCLAA